MVIIDGSVEVFENSKGKALRCLIPFKKHDIISAMIGTVVDYNDPRVDEFSMQINATQYLCGNPSDPEEFINHSCNPSCQMLHENDRVYLAAIRDIEAGEELTFNYNTTEFDMREHWFNCLCGSPDCMKEIKGYNHLTEEQKDKIKPYLAPYML